MSGKKILILSSAHLCRNPRVLKEATTLGAAGYDVTVASISFQDRFEKIDRELMEGLPFKRITLDYSSKATSKQAAYFFQRVATRLAGYLYRWLNIETAQCLGPATALLQLARSLPADLTIAHTEIPLWIARHLHSEGLRIAVDLEDWYSEDLLFADRRSRPVRLLRNVEEFALRQATYISVPSACMAEKLFAVHGGKKPIVLHNAFPLQPAPATGPRGNHDLPRFIWFSQTIGPGRGLELFLAAWARTDGRSEVYLLGDERAGYRDKLLKNLPETRRSDLHFIPPVPARDLPAKLAEFDIGLALEPHWPVNRNLAITNKIMQYLNAGLAVVATDTAGQSEVVKSAPDCGILVTAHETMAFTARLNPLINDRAKLNRARIAARAAAENGFSWEHDEPLLLDTVKIALG